MGFFRGDPRKFQDNQVGYLNLQIGDDAVRLKTRLGVSSYEASDRFFWYTHREKRAGGTSRRAFRRDRLRLGQCSAYTH